MNEEDFIAHYQEAQVKLQKLTNAELKERVQQLYGELRMKKLNLLAAEQELTRREKDALLKPTT